MKLYMAMASLFFAFSSFAAPQRINELPEGTSFAIYPRDIEIAANTKSVLLHRGLRESRNAGDIPFKYELFLKTSTSQRRTIRSGERFQLKYLLNSKKACNSGIDINYYQLKLFVDHPEIDYIKYSSGKFNFNSRKCINQIEPTGLLMGGDEVFNIGFGILGIPGNAPAASAPPLKYEYGESAFSILNTRERNVLVALTYLDKFTNKWTTTTWYRAEPSKIRGIKEDKIRTVADHYYLYIEDERSQEPLFRGLGLKKFCVHPSDAVTQVATKNCRGRQTKKRFKKIDIDSHLQGGLHTYFVE